MIFIFISNPGNTGNLIFLLSTILEILEIEVFNILLGFLYNPGNIGKRISPIFSYPGNTGNQFSPIFSCPGNTGGGRAAPGVALCCLGLFLEHVSWNFRISWKYWKYGFYVFLGFFQKRRAPKFHAGCTDACPEISHMRPIQAKN